MRAYCPLQLNRIHRLNDQGVCACGYTLVRPPISVTFSVFNNNVLLAGNGLHCATLAEAADILRQAAKTLEERAA